MVFLKQKDITVRSMQAGDIEAFTKGEAEQGWNTPASKYEMRISDMENGDCIALTAEYKGNAAGYVNVYFKKTFGAFKAEGYPEIVDFGVLEKYRENGIGGCLMDVAEKLAAEKSDFVYLGVGLHAGYGPAQRMYIKRGYIPDGSGVWYDDKPCTPYAEYINNDSLCLYLLKKLR